MEAYWDRHLITHRNDPGTSVVVVVVLLFYVHGKHLRSCRDGHLAWAGLDLLSG